MASTNLKFILSNLFLILLGSILYFSSLDNGFSSFAGDDNWMVYENDQIFNLRFNNIAYYFTNFYRGQYSPVNTLIYGIIYNFFGIDPFYFHTVSLILHVTNAVLVFLFIYILLEIKKGNIQNSEKRLGYLNIAFVTALLFLIHPIQVESVVWISASKVPLYSFFFILALIFYLKFVIVRQFKFYLLCCIFFIISFGAKEQAVVFPLILVLIDWSLGRKLNRGRIILEKIPFFSLSLVFSIISLVEHNNGFSHKLANEYYPMIDRIFLACYAFTEYLFKMVVPFKLSAWYKFPIDPGESLPFKYYFYSIVVIFMIYFLWQYWKRKNYLILFGMGFFIVNLMLTLHVLPMGRGVLMADRYVYLGSIGIFYIISSYLNKVSNNTSRDRSRLLFSVFILYLICLGGYTYWYIDSWNIL